MKKIISLILAFVLVFSMAACGDQVDENGATKIKFSQSMEDLKKLDGQIITINGFMSLLSPLDGTLIYLMNVPFQSCPFCLPNTNTLSNTIAVLSSDIKFTTLPVKVTGKLVFGDFTDGYGYQYSYRIEDAKIEEMDENEVSKKTKVYYTVAQDDYLIELFSVIDCIYAVSYYRELQINPETLLVNGISFDRYEEIKSSIESVNAKGEFDSFLSMLDQAETIRQLVNEKIKNKDFEAYGQYKAMADMLYDEFFAFIGEYEF